VNRSAVVAALVAALGAPLGAQSPMTLTIRTTTGADSRPVVGASVVIDSGAASVRRTDDQGAWSASVASGTHRVRIQAIGYHQRDTVIAVEMPVTVQLDLKQAIVPLGEVVVTAARREQRLADAVVETQLITSRDLREGQTDLAAVLTERAGIQLDGGVPAGAGIQMRGFGSRRVLVLLDGQPLVGRVNGTMDLARIPVSAIERIEIVKGPQSTLYGSDAIGGVINVISRVAPASGVVAGLATTTGTQGRTEISGDAGWRHGTFSSTVDAGYSGVDLVSGMASDQATYSRRANGGLRGDWAMNPSDRLEWGAFVIGERQRYRTGQLFHFGDNVQSSLRLGMKHDGKVDRLGATVSASTFDHLSRASTLDAPVSDSGSNDRQRLAQGELTWNAARGPGVLDAGVAVRHEWIDADRLSTETSAITGVEPFAQYTAPLGSFIVTPGVRVSWSDRWGRFVAPRLAAMVRPNDHLAIRGSIGRGFRAPDFKELYLSFVNAAAGYAVYGNPDLVPERSTSTSLGAEWTNASTYLRATAYNANYQDFIETSAPDANGVYTYNNVARGWSRGLEVESGILLRAWRLEAAGERLWTRDLATDRPLLGRTPLTLRGSVTSPTLHATRVTLRLAYASRTPVFRDEVTGVTTYRSAFPAMDLRLSRTIGERLELGAEATNVFDRQLGDAWPGFTGRRLLFQLRWRTDGLD